MRPLPLLAFLLVCVTASAQEMPAEDTSSPARQAQIVTVSRVGGDYVFEIDGQPRDLFASLVPGGTLVVRTEEDVEVLVVAEETAYSLGGSADTEAVARETPIIVGPNARLLHRSYDDALSVTTLRVLPEIHRGTSRTVAVTLLVCTGTDDGIGGCDEWRAARPSRPLASGGLPSGFFVQVIGPPVVYSPTLPVGGPPVRPVRD